MKGLRFLKGAAVGLAVVGMVVPQTSAVAAAPQNVVKTTPAKAPATTDVALASGGTFTGQIVDAQGKVVEGAAVSIRQAGHEVAKTTSDKNGAFAVTGLRSGTYHVVAGQGEGLYRFWSENTAPPSASTQAVLVSDATVVRGQCVDGGCYADTGCAGGMDTLTLIGLGAAVAGVTLAAINLSKLKDLEDDVDDMRDENRAFADEILPRLDDIEGQLDDIEQALDDLAGQY